MEDDSIETMKIGEREIPITDEPKRRPLRSFFNLARICEDILSVEEE